MKRIRKKNSRKLRKNSRAANIRKSQAMSYDTLEQRQMLAFDIGINSGFSLVGAALADSDINSVVPNAEGDVGPNHFVEFGEQTFTVYDRMGTIVEESSLNQFYVNAGGDLFGEDLQSPRVIYDRLSERWFAIATGDGNGVFEGNRIHIAFSDNSDPTGQWQQVDFVADITGLRIHDNVTLGVDADGVYFATQNFENGQLIDVSIYSIPKADLLAANPTLTNISQFNNLSVFDYGVSIQFASNFDASDGTVFAFSTQSQDVNGSGNAFESELNPSNINTFEIMGAAGDATLTGSTQVEVGVFVAPKPINQLTADQTATVEIEIDGGLTHSLVEQNGSVFAAQTVGGAFTDTVSDVRVNSINLFQLVVEAGEVPILANSPIHGDVSYVFSGGTSFVGFNIPDPPELDESMDPDDTPEFTGVSYFNPAIAVSATGMAAVTFNAVTSFDLLGTGAVVPTDGNHSVQGIETRISVGIPVNGGQGIGPDGPFFPRQAIQFEAPRVLQSSNATDAFTPFGGSQWGAYSSLRSDPNDPNSFFSISPFQDEVNDEWAVAVQQISLVDFQPVVEATNLGDQIIVRLDPGDLNVVEVEINGIVTDRFSQDLIRRLVVGGLAGADTIVVDYSNGDPTPSPTLDTSGPGGLLFLGDGGTDSIQSLTGENVDFILDNGIGNGGFNTPLFLGLETNPFGIGQNGTFTLVTENGADLPVGEQSPVNFVDIETVVGGSGDDTFTFVVGTLEGNAEGGDGDDRFVFTGDTRTDGSVNGGAGFNTLDVQQRISPTDIVLFSTGLNMGFNGRTVDGPIGQFNEVLDQFRDISLIRGSSAQDSIQALNQQEATYTLTIPSINPDDLTNPDDDDVISFVASSLEQGGAKVYFTNFDSLLGSVLDDTFNVQSNDGDDLPLVRLDGRTGDDTFNFSSDAPNNEGTLNQIGGLFSVNGGAGANSLVVSDEGRLGEADFLVLAARISTAGAGGLEVIYIAVDGATGNEGTFDVTLIGSDGTARDMFILQSFLPTNTLNVFGRDGDDIFVIQDLSQAEVNLFGGEGNDEYVIEQVNGVDDRNVTITDSVGGTEIDRAIIAGTLLDEIFIVDIDSFVSDQFVFIGVEEFGFDGRGGDDKFYVRAISEDFAIFLRGGAGNDTFYLSSDAPTNLGDLSTFNNDLTIDGGLVNGSGGIDRIIVSNESGSALDVEIMGDRIDGLFNGVLSYTSTNGVFGLVDENGDLDTENFGGIDITGSNGGDDSFQITSFLSQNSLVIDARLGEDEFTIGGPGSESDIQGVVVVDGASDGDTYTIFLENVATQNVIIDDSGFSGVDTIDAKGTAAADNISLTEFSISTDDVAIGIGDFIEQIVIEGLGGGDFITMTNAPAEFVSLSGNEGNDFIAVNGTVGVSELMILGGSGIDIINVQEASLLTSVEVFGGDDNDMIEVGNGVLGDIALDGQDGLDTFTVAIVGSGTRTVQIMNTGMELIDVIGSGNGDEFAISNLSVLVGAESVLFAAGPDGLDVSGGNGDDVFNVVESQGSSLAVRGDQGNDVFNFSSDAPSQSGNTLGIQSNVIVVGGVGLNRLNITNETGQPSMVTVTSDSISGLTNGFEFTYAGQFARPDGEIGGIHIIGSNLGGDSFDVQSINEFSTIRIEGLGGDDTFTIGNAIAGDALFDGGEGSDTYNFVFGAATAREIVINDTGTTGTDILNLSGSNEDDNIVISANNVSDGVSTLSFNIPLTVIEIFGLGGNDTFTINDSPTTNVTLHGNIGNDTFIVNNTDNIANLDLFGGGDADVFQFNGSADPTRIDADGGNGNDTYTVGTGAFGKLFLDGQEAGDTYTVFYAGEGARRINTRDTGIEGFDVTEVFGTDGDDRIAVRTTRFLYDDEVVIFDQNTERVSADSGSGDDRLVIFGSRSATTEVRAGGGNDNFVMNSGSSATTINLRGENGDDTYLIRKTTVDTATNLIGGSGNDRFNIGSTGNQDDGNLGRIRGALNVVGGSNDDGEEDQLLVNDHGVNAAYSYSITPNAIEAIPGPAGLDRTIFAGITYNSSTELVRLDGTQQANLFRVTASQTTRYFVDGNSPGTGVGDRLEVTFQPNDGRQMFITNAAQGAGFVTFSNGKEIVQFDDIESPSLVSAGGVSSSFTAPEGFDPGSFVEGGSDSELNLDEFFSNADLDDLV